MHLQAEQAGQPKGFWHIAALNMAEFFSYYGMRSLLVLFFTQYLLFSDEHAYTLYGAYTSLVWVTPIVGGYLADRLLGYYFSVTLGVIMIFLGNVVLALSGSSHMYIYIAMAIIICGYGFFKGNVSCLAGELYEKQDLRRNSGFSWLYIVGNIGAMLSAILCGWVAYAMKSWHAGFMLASIFLFLGILFFISGHKHFKQTLSKNTKILNNKILRLKNKYWMSIGLLLAIAFFTTLLYHELAGYLLVIIGIISAYFLTKIMIKSTTYERKSTLLIFVFMIFGTIFWVFNQQNGSSVALFIQRNINKDLFGMTIPTPSFQSINSGSVIVGGAIIVWLWRVMAKANIHIPSLIKLSFGSVLLTAGFFLITIAAYYAHHSPTGQTSMLWVILGMILIGVAELFVDPIATANITRLNPANSGGVLIGIYMLVTGSFANYIAGQLASMTDINFYGNITTNELTKIAGIYNHVFKNITITGALITLLLIVFSIVIHRLLKIKE